MMKNNSLGKRENVRILVFGISMVIISFVILFCVAVTVEGKDRPDAKAMARFYSQKEAEWKPLIRTCLEEAGFHNAGIMITHREDGEGNREYTILVHHQRVGKLTEEERTHLEGEIAALAYQDDHCLAMAELTD